MTVVQKIGKTSCCSSSLQSAVFFSLQVIKWAPCPHEGPSEQAPRRKWAATHMRGCLFQPPVSLPLAQWEAYRRGSLPLHNLGGVGDHRSLQKVKPRLAAVRITPLVQASSALLTPHANLLPCSTGKSFLLGIRGRAICLLLFWQYWEVQSMAHLKCNCTVSFLLGANFFFRDGCFMLHASALCPLISML